MFDLFRSRQYQLAAACSALALALSACSQGSDHEAANGNAGDDVEDGTMVNNEHREVVYDYFEALRKADDAKAEREVATGFAAWLNKHGYKLEVESNEDGSHNLACPYMPTVTPWTDYTFRDPGNLALLPQL